MTVTVLVKNCEVGGVIISRRVVRTGLKGKEINALIKRLLAGGYYAAEIFLKQEQTGRVKSVAEIVESKKARGGV